MHQTEVKNEPEIVRADQFTDEEKQALAAIENQFKQNQISALEKRKTQISFKDYSIFVCNSELSRIQEMQKMLNQAVKDYNSLKKKLNKTADATKVEEIMLDYPNFKPAYEKALKELSELDLKNQQKAETDQVIQPKIDTPNQESLNESIKTESN